MINDKCIVVKKTKLKGKELAKESLKAVCA